MVAKVAMVRLKVLLRIFASLLLVVFRSTCVRVEVATNLMKYGYAARSDADLFPPESSSHRRGCNYNNHPAFKCCRKLHPFAYNRFGAMI